MPPVTRNQSITSIIDLTSDDIAPPSPPRPTVANHSMAPRRRMRDGSTSTSTTTVTTGSSGSGSRGGSRGVGIGPSSSAGRRRNGNALKKNEVVDEANDYGDINGNGPSTINGTRPNASTSKPSRPSLRRKRSSSESSIVALEAPPEGMVGLAGKRRKVNGNVNGQVNGQADRPDRKVNGKVNGKGKARATSADLDMDGVERGIDVDVDVDLSLDEDDLEIGGGKRRVRRAGYGGIEIADDEETGHAEGDEDDVGDGHGGINGIPEESLLASFQCPICLAPPIQAVLTPCGHVTCGACLFSTLKTQAIRERRPPNPTGQLPTSGPGMKKPRGKADQEAWFRRFGADPKTGRIRGKILTGSCPVCRHDIEGGLGQPGEGGCIYLEICTVSSVL
ncbi:hypothetical protein FFLO_05222 [Filobasidium floriforme]|uniref:RING-type domain-containing protein n=1 Tax=Filobasidium floriforme TaxID=5210 RepID=A0A8K0JHV8_9TREE|nr:uncharacterized protein HD553DRAFT_307736 [Filobasidium floriforme]KAG7530174.1 hypothetical protein FFLO_05222 [Filobasidium floriforme]KAH8087245.1 hypothetical protein HD553DRAFT_307736 [Filobasidium floriforme]